MSNPYPLPAGLSVSRMAAELRRLADLCEEAGPTWAAELRRRADLAAVSDPATAAAMRQAALEHEKEQRVRDALSSGYYRAALGGAS